LNLEGEAADLVEEKDAPARGLEVALTVADRGGKATLAMSEEQAVREFGT
jgi:hypothetical protein